MNDVELTVLKQALQRTRADLQAFAYSVSHDLRAPLRAIQGFSKILIEDYSEKLDAEAKHFLRHIIQNTQLLSSQLDDLLRFSRAGKTEPNKTEINTSTLIDEIIEQLRPEIPPQTKIESSGLPMIHADLALIRIALSELLGNAIKFSAKKPSPEIEITGREDAHSVAISFRDNGVGFDQVHAGKLFQVFQKLHSMTEFSGNGMGLALVKRIVEAHGGCVEAEGAVDTGALFTIRLPRRENTIPLECAPLASKPAPLEISA